MSESPQQAERELTIELKDPALAAFLAWLVPGLGHIYQGRVAKGILFFVCIMSTFVYGLYLGGNSELGWGRVVYASWRPGDRRLPYLCQVCAGLPALPALVQASRVRSGKPPLANGFMAPPWLGDRAPQGEYTVNELHLALHRFFELGTVFTMVAGFLNVLAIYDAWGGPMFAEEEEEEEEDDPTDEDLPGGSDAEE